MCEHKHQELAMRALAQSRHEFDELAHQPLEMIILVILSPLEKLVQIRGPTGAD